MLSFTMLYCLTTCALLLTVTFLFNRYHKEK